MDIEAIVQNAEITSTSSCGRYFNRVAIPHDEYDFLTEKTGIKNEYKGYGDDYIEMDYHGEFMPLIEMARSRAKQTISKGDFIYAIDENRKLEVEGMWPPGINGADFQAKYSETNLVDFDGNKVYGNRGFKFKEEGSKWKRI